MPCDMITVIAAVAPPKPQIYNICWGPTLSTSGTCPSPTQMPAVIAGSLITIKSDIANSGPSGRVNVIFKIDGVSQYNDTNINLPTFRTSSDIWSPSFQYTIPTKNVLLTVEAYGWDASKSAWVLGQSQTVTISTSVPSCTGIDLVPYSASIKTGEKVDMIASVSPGNVPFTVTFKDRAGTVLGTCKTSGTGSSTSGSTCPFTWDSNASYAGGGKAGTYYVKAYTNSCISTECVIVVNAPILQYNFNVTVKDSISGSIVPGATVQVSTVGGASQSKVTDTNGFASFRMDSGTINVSISKDKYNTFNTAESLYMDRSITYSIVPIPPTPTVGNIEFVSVPVGADILIDGKAITGSPKTPATITDIPAGSHSWTLKLSGYNDSTGTIVVPSGGTTSVYATLTQSTPTSGSLNITSTPMGAEIWIDGKNTNKTTSGATVITNIPPGSHTYVLTMYGFQDKTGTFSIIVGQTTYLDIELVPLTTIGTLEIDSEPSGARISVDDKDTQRVTPATIFNLSAGDHKYKVVLSGYKDISGIFTIKSGETTKVHLILEKSGPGLEVLAAVAIATVAVATFAKGEG